MHPKVAISMIILVTAVLRCFAPNLLTSYLTPSIPSSLIASSIPRPDHVLGDQNCPSGSISIEKNLE